MVFSFQRRHCSIRAAEVFSLARRIHLRGNELYLIALILLLSFLSLNISAIKRMDLPNKLTTSFIAYLYPLMIVLLGLGVLKLLLPVLE